jgi:hypothetical protein
VRDVSSNYSCMDSSCKRPNKSLEQSELLPASQTPSLGVMMKPEVANGNEADVQSGVQV